MAEQKSSERNATADPQAGAVPVIRLAIIGDEGVGKTELLRWLKDELSSNDQAKRLRRGKSVRAKPTSTRRRFLDPTLYLRFLALHGL